MKMPTIGSLSFYLVVVFVLTGCSVEITQAVPPAATAAATSAAAPTNWKAPNLAWQHLGLSGRLIYITRADDVTGVNASLQMLDLSTGALTTLWEEPGAWIYYVTVSPDARWLAMSYAPPRPANAPANRQLYIMPLDGSAPPSLLFTPAGPADRYTQVEWSTDGAYIYYVSYNQDESAGQLYETNHMFRMRYPDGAPEPVADLAYWMRPSPDATRLVYVTLDTVSGTNEMFVSNADGGGKVGVELSGPVIPEFIDAPLFAPDGETILFSAPSPVQSYRPSWFEKWLGVGVAKAHTVPSDWWSVPVLGGVPKRLTQIQSIGLFGSLSPDGRFLASVSSEGIFVMQLDGSNLTQLIADPGVHGTVRWIP